MQRFRLAIRMSFTITLSFILMWSVGGIKIIWIPMNVFLLLHPVKAEMNTRIKTRFWGTLLGCFLSLFVVNWLQLPLTHLVVSSLIGIFVYALKPGTVLQVTMATILGYVWQQLVYEGCTPQSCGSLLYYWQFLLFA